jgi:hypothetical protein
VLDIRHMTKLIPRPFPMLFFLKAYPWDFPRICPMSSGYRRRPVETGCTSHSLDQAKKLVAAAGVCYGVFGA